MAAGNRRRMPAPQHRTLKRLAILTLLLFSTASPPAAAQPPPPARPATNKEGRDSPNVSPVLCILIAASISILFLLLFFFIYIGYCIGGRSTVTPAAIALSRHEARIRGLDSALIRTFPTMAYSDVKGHRLGKDALECAVCLCEFEDDDLLRLLPVCSHVFHRDCVDVWLDSHVSCPVCRSDLAADPSPEIRRAAVAVDQEMDLTDLVRIGSQRRVRSGSLRGVPMSPVSRGDWEAVVAGGDGRFRLQLSEDVMKEIVLGEVRLRRSASLGVFPAGGEGSLSRGWLWRSLRLGRSARWPIMARSSSSARGRETAAEGHVARYSKGGEVATVKGSSSMMNGGGSRVRPDGGDASTAAWAQV